MVGKLRSGYATNRTSMSPVRIVVPVPAIERVVARVFDALGYRGDRDPMANHRIMLDEGLKVDLPELQELLRGVRVSPSLLGKRPATRFGDLQDGSTPGIRPKLRTVSSDDGQALTEHRRREVLQELHALAIQDAGQ